MATFVISPLNSETVDKSQEIEVNAETDIQKLYRKLLKAGKISENCFVELSEGSAEEIDIWDAIRETTGEIGIQGLVDFEHVFREYSGDLPAIYYLVKFKNMSVENIKGTHVRRVDIVNNNLRQYLQDLIEDGLVQEETIEQYTDKRSLAKELNDTLDGNGDWPDDAIDENGEFCWSARQAREYLDDYIESVGVLDLDPERQHFDFDAFTEDMRNELAEFTFGEDEYVVVE